VDPILKMALKAGLGFQERTDKHNGKMNTNSFYAIKHYMIYAIYLVYVVMFEVR
jgi:hypothetical protein